MTAYAYRADQELPSYSIGWTDSAGAVLDFSTGYTATVKVALVSAPTTVILTKTTNITLAATSPNYVIDFTTAELATMETAAGTIPTGGVECVVYAYCRRDSDSRDRVFKPGDEPRFRLHTKPV